MDTEGLGPMPEPQVEPGPPPPGGADAVEDRHYGSIPDLTPEDNPMLEEIPDPLKQLTREGEDTSTKATRAEDGTNADDEPHQESPA